jgi:hypothetical protein
MIWIAIVVLSLLVIVLATRFVELQHEVQNLVAELSEYATLDDIESINRVRLKAQKKGGRCE